MALLEFEPWVSQPTPYQRSDGAELPWADVWADRRDSSTPLPPELGTYELLFQSVIGRYCQLEITVSGGGRSSATIRSVRAWFPRFSYVEQYLPAIYAEHDLPDRFLERFLANPEGILTALEEKIEHSHLILDARTAREVDLPWLAAWFGLVLDPLWTPARRRFLIRNVDAFYRRRGTVAGLLAILRVFFDDEQDLNAHSIFAVGAVPATSSRIRLVERFLTRDRSARPPARTPGRPSPSVRSGGRRTASTSRCPAGCRPTSWPWSAGSSSRASRRTPPSRCNRTRSSSSSAGPGSGSTPSSPGRCSSPRSSSASHCSAAGTSATPDPSTSPTGWSPTGTASAGCPPYDHHLTRTSIPNEEKR